MRIRFLSFLMTILLTASLAGCAKPAPGEGEHSSAASSGTSEPSEASETSKQPSEPEQATWKDLATGRSYDLSALEKVSDGIYRLPGASFEREADLSVAISPTVLLVTYSYFDRRNDYRQEYSCYDLATGALLGSISDSEHSYTLLDCGLIAQINCDYGNGRASLLNPDFSEALQITPENDEGLALNVCKFSTDGRYLVVALSGQSFATIYSLVDRRAPVKVELPGEAFSGYAYRDYFYLDCAENAVILDPAAGSAEVLPEWGLGENGLAPVSGSVARLLRDPDTLLFLGGGDGCWLYGYGYGSMLLCDWSTADYAYFLLDIASGKRIELGRSDALAVTDGLACFTSGGEIFLVDIAAAPGSTSGAMLMTADEMDEGIASITAELAEAYGITLLTGGDGNDFLAGDYAAAPILDRDRIYDAALVTKNALARYPEGMLRELSDKVNSISLYFCGRLAPTDGSGISTAAAIAFEENGHRAIAADVSGSMSLAENLSHELMHVMDDLLLLKESETGIPYLNGWEQILPEGISYEYSYHEDAGSRYTLSEEKPELRWFIDSYAKSFPTEDRARIMEYLLLSYEEARRGNADYGKQYFDAASVTPLAEKGALLCRLLRECFDSLKNAPVQPWEEPVQGIGIPAAWMEIFGLK